ncbi:protein bm-dcp-isoform f [Diplodia corticola]|uniref:Protein bm-dcp-isoform f n=1 Tax=Diplodia corticola TaxID=236234 RepID=A0A1J9QX86_9PEZI|nr:protein bm-dcp-isoform f [Diplodia corticola]OJD33630.1 protein bm-dcp-isoform f [Diplodia corticola]
MVTRATAPPADGGQQMPPRLSAVNLPSIQDLNLGAETARAAAAAQPSFQARGFATHLSNPPPSRPALPHLPHSQTFGSFEQRDRGAVESAAPSPTQGALHTPATPSFPAAQLKDECSRCGAPLSSAQAECSSCGHFRFIHPFQPHARHLGAGFDDTFQVGPMSRRGSGARSSFDSFSCGSNPPSRRGSCVAYPGVTKPTSRRKSVVTSRKTSFQQELQQKNKANREKCSRRALRHEHKKMEIRQQARGWFANTDLNTNNKKNSGLDGKKLEILQQTNKEARNKDLMLLLQYTNQRRMLQLLQSKAELTADNVAWLRDVEHDIELDSRKLVKALEAEDVAIENYFEKESQKEADAMAKERKNGRYPTPLSSSTSPSPTPTCPPY